MFLWCVFIDKLHGDNSVHVFTSVFIMCNVSCIYGVYRFIHSGNNTYVFVPDFINESKLDKLHDDNSVHIFTSVFIMCNLSCIHGVYTFIQSFINNTYVFVPGFINESKLSLSLSLFIPKSIPVSVFSSHGAYMI